MRASIQASGTPNTMARPVDHRRAVERQRSASRALSDVRISQASDHGAFHSRPMNGKREKRRGDDGQDEDRDRQAFPADPAMNGDRSGPAP